MIKLYLTVQTKTSQWISLNVFGFRLYDIYDQTVEYLQLKIKLKVTRPITKKRYNACKITFIMQKLQDITHAK